MFSIYTDTCIFLSLCCQHNCSHAYIRKYVIVESFQKKFEGTRVTIENFLAWKTKFDAEMAEVSKRKQDSDSIKNKLTGTRCTVIL